MGGGELTLVRSSIIALGTAALAVLALPSPVRAQVKAKLPASITPPWSKGIQPISRDSYYNAIECGKQGGQNPPCVFWDTGLCKNDQFTLDWYTPYKQIAYEVWQAVSRHQDAPTPSYAAAQRTRVIIGVKPLTMKNGIESLTVKRGAQTIEPATRSLEGGGSGRFIFDFAAFAPTADVTLVMKGKTGTVTCAIDRPVLARLR
jgi:hypothetical protein